MLKNSRDKHCKNGRLCFFIIIILLSVFLSGHGLAADSASNNTKAISSFIKSSPVENQRLLVRFKKGVTNSSKVNLHRSLGSHIKKSFRTVPGLQVIEVAPGKSAEKVLREYQKDPLVLYAETDQKIRLKVTPNDTSFSSMWGLNNTGQSAGTNDADINAPQAWDVTTGNSNVVVAVIDTGVDYNHADLVGNMWTNPGEIANNGIDDDGNSYVDDIHGIDPADIDSDPMDIEGHGTHVAGTIGATGNNSLGVTGINWNVSIIACKIFSSSPLQDTEAFVSDAVDCLEYVRDLKLNHGINIVATNNSWGWVGNPSQTLINAIERQIDAGILFVAAAGNDSLDTDEILDNPSGYYLPNIISVAASDRNDSLASFSNTGKRTVHVAAPGDEILSTVPMGTGTVGGGNYDTLSGTSMASPHVVGLLALLKAQDNTRDWISLKNLLISSGTPLTELANTTVSGRRIRAFDSDDTGGMTCTNQSVLSRLQPRTDYHGIAPGTTVGISMLHINCGAPASEIAVHITETDETITLSDNGVDYDQVAGDGIYSAQINLNDRGLERATIDFPDSTTVNVRNVYNYLPAVSIPYQWRDISLVGQTVVVGDDETGYINSPFGILFGNNTSPYTKLAIDTNGYIVMQRTGDPILPVSIYENFQIPFNVIPAFVAPFWDDLVIVGSSNLIWGVLGSAPNRELVVTWNNVEAFGGSPGISFQVVFKENSSDVIVNYQDLDAPDASTDFGGSATVGLQVAPDIGQEYSYNNATRLTNNMSLRWSMPPGVENLPEDPPSATPPGNVAPIANAGSVHVVSENDFVILNGSGIDSDGTINSYSWTQVNGMPVTINNANTQNASFTAPQVDGTISLTFQLAVTDNDGAVGTDQVAVVVNNLSTSQSPIGRISPGGGGGSFGILSLLLLPMVILVRIAGNGRIRR